MNRFSEGLMYRYRPPASRIMVMSLVFSVMARNFDSLSRRASSVRRRSVMSSMMQITRRNRSFSSRRAEELIITSMTRPSLRTILYSRS